MYLINSLLDNTLHWCHWCEANFPASGDQIHTVKCHIAITYFTVEYNIIIVAGLVFEMY